MSRDEERNGKDRSDKAPFPPNPRDLERNTPKKISPCQHAADPDLWESDLWIWLNMAPDDPAQADLERRILSCPYCLAGALTLARAETSAAAKPGWSLQQVTTRLAALERTHAMEKNDWFRTAITIFRNGLFRLDSPWAGQPAAAVRARPGTSVDPDVTSERHEIGDLEVSMEVEKTGDSECRVAVWVKDRKSGKPSTGMAYLSGEDGTVYESFPFHDGEIVFSGVSAGTYFIGVDTEDAPAGRIRLEIGQGR